MSLWNRRLIVPRERTHTKARIHLPVLPSSPPASQPKRNLFAIIRSYLKKNRREAAALYGELDPARTGYLTEEQAAALVRRVVPDVTPGELRYFWSMVDADGARG